MNNVVKNGFKKTCLALVCSMSLFMTACNDDDNDSFRPQERVFLSQQSYDEDTLPEASDIQVIRYNMPNVNGERLKRQPWCFIQIHLNLKTDGGWWFGNMARWVAVILVHQVITS